MALGSIIAAALRSQYRVGFATDIHALVHLLLCAVQRVLPCSERRGNEQKFLPFHRERIPRSMFRTLGSLERIVFHPELPALCRHLLHHLSVILLQAVLLNDFLQVLGIFISSLYTFPCSFPSIIGSISSTNSFAADFFT